MNSNNQRRNLKISARVLYDELCRQKIPAIIIDAPSSLMSYTDRRGESHLLFSTCSDKSAASGMAIASNKHHTTIIADQLDIPTPDDRVCEEYKEALDFFEVHKTVVTKPLINSGGTGVTIGITDENELKKSYLYAKYYDRRVIVQQHVKGDDVRLLIIGGTFRSAVQRIPAQVMGDGLSTIKELISMENKSSTRDANSMAAMDLIDVAGAARYLGESINGIPAKGHVARVMGPANLSRGGTAHEATNLVSPQMIADAQKISRRLKLGMCGVDMIWDRASGAYSLIEVNATPGVNMHNDPFWGTSSDAVQKYVQWLVA